MKVSLSSNDVVSNNWTKQLRKDLAKGLQYFCYKYKPFWFKEGDVEGVVVGNKCGVWYVFCLDGEFRGWRY